MKMLYYDDSRLALNAAAAQAPACVGYMLGKGWFVYDPRDGCPADCEPEFFIAKRGIHPFPLTKTAAEVWLSGIMAAAPNSGPAPSYRALSGFPKLPE